MKEGVRKPEKEKDVEEEENNRSSEDETADGNSSNTDCDQDSDISFMKDTDEEIDTSDIEEEEEEWIEYMKRSTDVAIEPMKRAKIQCWIKTHKRMKRRLAMRIASLPEERWEGKQHDGTLNSAQNTKHSEPCEDQRKEGKLKSMTSSDWKETKMKQATLKEIIFNGKDSERSGRLEENGKQVRNGGSSRSRHRAPAQKENG